MFEAGTVVDPELLMGVGLINSDAFPVKVLANGVLPHALTVRADKFSEEARAKIEAAGGTAEVLS
jgi:large subunit ribosomal protein L15